VLFGSEVATKLLWIGWCEVEERGSVRRLPGLALLIVVFGLASCHGTPAASTAITCTSTAGTTSTTSSTNSCTDPTTSITVTITPATNSLNVLTTTQFFANVSGGTNSIVTWQVNSITGGNDTVGRIDSNGLYRAPGTVPSPAIVNVGAVSFEDQKLSATSATTILPPPTVTISPTCTATPCTVTSGAANTLAFTATVTGATTTNADWFVNGVLGGNSTFGTISATGVYTAPNTPPIGSTVTVTVESRDFPQAFAHATVTISGYSTSSFQGPFAFSMTGTNASGAFARAGSFTADGAGHLSGGLEDVNAASCVTANPISFVGIYSISTDGRGTMTFADGCTPATFSFVLVNNNQLQITGFDAAGTASGQANLQDPAVFRASGLLGAYVFDFTGVDGSSKFLSLIGEFTADGQGGITKGLADTNDAGAITPQVAFTGSYQVSSNGRGTATLGSSHFSFYIVSPGSAKFAGTDATLVVAGQTTQQAPDAVFNLTSLNGSFAFLLTGSGPGGAGNIATAGNFAAVANGLLTAGVLDRNANGTPATNVTFSNGSYTVASNGRGMATFSTTPSQTFVFYLSATGSAVFQETDSSMSGDGIFTQQQNAPFSLASSTQVSNYALQTAGLSGTSPQTIAGQVTANGSGAIPSGTIDINTAGTLTPGQALTGTYTSPATNGRATLTLTSSINSRTFAIYVVNSMQVFVLESDVASPVRLASGAMYRRF
jgi:hypothetical protein